MTRHLAYRCECLIIWILLIIKLSKLLISIFVSRYVCIKMSEEPHYVLLLVLEISITLRLGRGTGMLAGISNSKSNQICTFYLRQHDTLILLGSLSMQHKSLFNVLEWCQIFWIINVPINLSFTEKSGAYTHFWIVQVSTSCLDWSIFCFWYFAIKENITLGETWFEFSCSATSLGKILIWE